MAKADRLAQLDEHRATMEREYRLLLISALERCATGKWGLFAHNKDRQLAILWAPVIEELTDLAGDVDEARKRLGLPPFDLHAEFMASRGPVDASAVGEPKQAKAWLGKLAAGIP
ncbi:hypothetical protein [Sphingomonas alpina]|uniref:Uncharacterized protein n=1 Tax=Sphingomonas alpina TaxID=653931 RepID=A0A7H0LMM1_9SPHN|nr:hypothetical protein [Sphingomonas alpina]QNQ10924.1 hypothetical protein H3Z74_07020 [Sphingomonas alpina]